MQSLANKLSCAKYRAANREKIAARVARYYARNRELIIANEQRRYQKKRTEIRLARRQRYASANTETILIRKQKAAQSRVKRREQNKQYYANRYAAQRSKLQSQSRNLWRGYVEEASPVYVRSLLKDQGFPVTPVTPEIIKLKRELLLTKRLCRKLKTSTT